MKFAITLRSTVKSNTIKHSNMKRLPLLACMAVTVIAISCMRYETVAGDPLGTKIYTLDNGLKV